MNRLVHVVSAWAPRGRATSGRSMQSSILTRTSSSVLSFAALLSAVSLPPDVSAQVEDADASLVDTASVDTVLVDALVVPGPGEGEETTPAASDAPFDPTAYRAMPLPKSRDEDRDDATPLGSRTSIDLRTREVSYGDGLELLERIEGFRPGDWSPGSAANGERLFGDPDGGTANFSSLSLQSTSQTESFPNRTTVKLFQSYRDQNGVLRNYVCSGTLIDPSHVLTAGHCIYSHDDADNGWVFNDWAETVTVVPAFRNGNQPFGSASATQLHSFTGWTQDESFNGDIGLIDLDRPIGALTGWLGYGWSNSCGFYDDTHFTSPGYPAESPFNGQLMYSWNGNFDSCDTILGIWVGNEVGFDRRSYGGQSGSGAWYSPGSGRFVRAVLSNGNSSHTDYIRMNENFFDSVGNWIAQDTPSSVDLVCMDTTVSPSAVRAGDQIGTMNYLVHNYSSATFSGTVTARVYLSTNNGISASDTLLQTHTFTTTLTSKQSRRINVTNPPSIPNGTGTGSYFIGVILDINDNRTSNNDSSGQDAAAVSVLPVGCNDRNLAFRGTISPTLTPQTRSDSVTAATGRYYTVNVTTPGVYTFTLCSDGGSAGYDTWLCLFDDDFVLLTEEDDSCGLQSEITRSLAPGTYRVAVSGYSSSVGSYTLAYFKELTCNGRTLSNGGNLSLVAAPRTATGSVTEDVGTVYSFSLAETSTCTFSFCSDGGSADYDTWLCLFDENGEQIAFNDDRCSLQSEIVWTLTPGSYRIAVSGFSDRAGSYTLAYHRRGTCNNRQLDPAAAITAAFETRTVGGAITATLGAYHPVRVNERGTYIFSTCGPEGAADYDSWLCLFDANWNVLASNDDLCSLQSEVSGLLAPGNYFLGVSGFSSRNGAYTVAYFGIPTCNGRQLDQIGSLQPAFTPQQVSGSVGPTDADAYTVRAAFDGLYSFETCGRSDWDTWLCLYDSNWEIVSQNDDACALQSRLTTSLRAGVYHLSVSGFRGASGRYGLTHSAIPACRGRTPSLAREIVPTTSVRRVEDTLAATDSRVYPVRIDVNGEYRFTFCSDGGTATWDTVLCLYDLSGRPLTENDNSCRGQSEIAARIPAGSYLLAVSGGRGAGGSYRLAYFRESSGASGTYIRCDHNCDGQADLTDAVRGLNQLFINPTLRPCCDQVTDCNSDGRRDLADWIFLLTWRFNGGPVPGDPFPNCGGEGCPEHPTCN